MPISHLRSPRSAIDKANALTVVKDSVSQEGCRVEDERVISIAIRVRGPGRCKWMLQIYGKSLLLGDLLSQLAPRQDATKILPRAMQAQVEDLKI